MVIVAITEIMKAKSEPRWNTSGGDAGTNGQNHQSNREPKRGGMIDHVPSLAVQVREYIRRCFARYFLYLGLTSEWEYKLGRGSNCESLFFRP